MPLTPEKIKECISCVLPCEHIELEGDGRHFFATIVSSIFEGKNRISRHQLVYDALRNQMNEEIHALSMRTLTFYEWKKMQNKS